MNSKNEQARHWDPLPNLPENVVAKLVISYEPETGCIVIASYGEGSRKLRIRFPQPEAFKAYEEFSDPAYGGDQPLERMAQAGWGQPWPFLEIENSLWVARVVARNGSIADRRLRHCVIRSFDLILHVMFAGDPEVQLVG